MSVALLCIVSRHRVSAAPSPLYNALRLTPLRPRLLDRDFITVVTDSLLQRKSTSYLQETNVVVSEAARQHSHLIDLFRLAVLDFRFGQRVAGKLVMGCAQATRSWGTLVTLVAKHACRGEGLWSQPR